MILFVYFTLRNNNKNNEQFLKKKTLNRICRDQEAKITINAGAFDTSSETQGQIVGARESLNRGKNMAQKKSKER